MQGVRTAVAPADSPSSMVSAMHGTRAQAFSSVMLLLSLGAASARAGQPDLPTDPVLAALIEQSLAARPELSQARAAAKAEWERVPQVGALPDPMLQLGVQNDSFDTWNVGKMETSWYSIMVTQTFPWPGKRRLRSEIAELGATQTEQSVRRVALSTEADVRRAYLSLMLALDRLTLLDRLEGISQRAAAVAQARYEAGSAAQSDVLRAHLELDRIRQRRWTFRAEADTSLQALNRIRGHPLDEAIRPPVGIVELAVPTLRTDAVAIQDALDRSPELASARAGVTQGERTISLAGKSYWPDFTLSLGVMPRGGLPPMWLATVGVPIPIFAGSKQNRSVAESEARLVANQTNAQALEQVLRLRVQQRRTALASTLETIQIYRAGLLAKSEATADSTLAQYEVGKVTFLSVLEANAGLVSDIDGYLQVLAQAQRIEIDSAEISLNSANLQDSSMGSGKGGDAMQTGVSSPVAGMPAPTSSVTAPTGSGSSSGPGM